MATTIDNGAARPRPLGLAPTRVERVLAWLSAAMLLVVCTALGRGLAAWNSLPAIVWFHIGTMLLALALTPIILLRRRGDLWHRRLGYVWVGALVTTSVATFWVRISHPGHLGPIHILSVFTLVQVPRAILAARRHDIAAHRRSITLLVSGALLIAGFFTFLPSRLLGHWLLS
ncbi:DUF2306 domain-containing protein [Sphingosinicella sp. BN140058]|uniref:DUF2306 domain-containing protein n=1 Tax=Sphingosinicella sp. BN140058 TaxID=1892855 RepID=UPI0010122534|nr:DUF2306 domain-containing protein [Sphingosinicella sp. BN140058]QAY79409.1 DUF2306 domain-containing protein [Sphingosinicella sp. BN140058]